MYTDEEPIKVHKERRVNRENESQVRKSAQKQIKKKQKKEAKAGKHWLNYITEGPHYSLNNTGEANFISSKSRKKQFNNVSVNSA